MDVQVLGKILGEFVSGLIILDDEEKIIWADSLAVRAGRKNEIVGRKFAEVFPIDLVQPTLGPVVVKGAKGEKYHLQTRDRVLDGRRYTFVSLSEMTDMSRPEARLSCMENIIELIDDGVMMSDLDGRIVLYNSALEKMEDMSAENVLGKQLSEIYNYLDPEEYLENSEHQQVFATGVPIINKYKAFLFKDGVPKYISYSTYPIRIEGETVAACTICRNETRLQSLLSDIIEIKRNIVQTDVSFTNKKQSNGTKYTFSDIVGTSGAIQRLIKDAQMVSLLDSTLLISGETGTGKEVFAQSIHNFGKNAKEPFIAINCAAIPESLLESILFGTVKGAFTGAIDQIGLFEEARAGTLFLDEISSMPMLLQAKLLRVLQDMSIRRVGALSVIPVRCRVICATNEDPQILIAEGRLRQDLFFRIARIALHIPPLRGRRKDIANLTEVSIKKYNLILHKNVKSLSPELYELLMCYNWPGNVRELEHVMENLMIRVENNQTVLGLAHLPAHLKKMLFSAKVVEKIPAEKPALPDTLKKVEKKLILDSLERNKWNYLKTAKELGIIRQSLEYRMKKLGIAKKNRS